MGKLIYIMDPMCGWCYGFGKTMELVNDRFGDRVEIEVIPGGMWVDGGMMATSSKLYEFVEKSMLRIEEMSGLVFGDAYKAYLKHEGHLLDSFPGSKAIVTASLVDPDRAILYAKALQQKIFVEGKGFTAGQWEAFVEAANEVGIDKVAFIENYQSDILLEKTRRAFQRAKGFGINGYPALFYQSGERLRSVATGFETFDIVEKKLEALLK